MRDFKYCDVIDDVCNGDCNNCDALAEDEEYEKFLLNINGVSVEQVLSGEL